VLRQHSERAVLSVSLGMAKQLFSCTKVPGSKGVNDRTHESWNRAVSMQKG
jgi:hypothetical protein